MVVTLDFRSQLLARGLLIDTGVDGIYLRSGEFENIVRKVSGLISAMFDYEVLYCPPVIPRVTLERSGYQKRFPDLMGTVNESRDVALASVVCHSVYPLYSGKLPKGGRCFEVFGNVFRHEPSHDPFRMQTFRTQEFIYMGAPEGAVTHRQLWLERYCDLFAGLGLSIDVQIASDPFFGRAGKFMSSIQRSKELKYEIVWNAMALCSANYHLDHFSREFGILTSDGEVAHTACSGPGLERVALALIYEGLA
jgi:seryl-tRNA synthetase